MQFRFDYSYSKQAGGWMNLHRVPATFTDAFLRCKAEGMQVVGFDIGHCWRQVYMKDKS
jgi:hypothetical protein